ncbi:hypothetical protein B0O80DRAFT_22950 [Mortierella sp. GBAus27b]|nr:hypothetical protein B0O80DRAFT_22950 [Mortierella sp. GBAus27b]
MFCWLQLLMYIALARTILRLCRWPSWHKDSVTGTSKPNQRRKMSRPCGAYRHVVERGQANGVGCSMAACSVVWTP